MTGNVDNRAAGLPMGRVDWAAIGVYLVLVLFGWLNIYSTAYEEGNSAIFDLSRSYGRQMIWIGVSLFAAVVLLLVEKRYYHILAYPVYIAGLLSLVAVLLVGREIGGAKAWIYIGSVAIQPSEFVKFATALALARYVGHSSFNPSKRWDFITVFAIILLPAALIMMQPDTGSAIVFGALLVPLFREGMNVWVFIITILAVALFVLSLVLEPFTIELGLVVLCAAAEGFANGHWKEKLMYLAGIAMGTIAIYFTAMMLAPNIVSLSLALMITVGISLPFAVMYAYRRRLRSVAVYVALFIGSVAFSSTVDYVFDNVLPLHQQKRILSVLGIENDLMSWGYNVNQSKIAIGSGGLAGKGFLEGTQTKFNFVPEQTTDFIFCTVGEEWGFLGSAAVVALFGLLILRLMRMGERQRDPFGRVYCYGVAAIFFMHVAVNIGMAIGILPVIGIPLPLFSYGGSSMLAFSILFFVAVKFDMESRSLAHEY